MEVFLELMYILLIAVAMGTLMQFLRQPLIIGHIATGILVAVTGIVSPGDAIEGFAHIGIVLLLFLVGLNLSPKTIKETGKVALITGLGQVIFTSVFGYLIALALGFEGLNAIYLAVALTFSSTIIISKLLSDKAHLQTLYGRISIGFLIIQDIVAIILLMLLTGLDSPVQFLITLGIIAIAGVIMAYFLKYIIAYMAKSQELLLLFSIALCITVAGSFQIAGLSLEAGALVAGMALSASRFRHEISARLKPLRDFFILMFFIILGSQMDFTSVADLMIPAILLSIFILIGNPLIVMTLMGLMGYPKKVGYQAGLTVAQISEFSLILVALGVSLGQVSPEILSLVTIVGVITIAMSTYLIMYSEKLYPYIQNMLSVFERKEVKKHSKQFKHKIILFGCNRLGFSILKTFAKLKKKFLVIDYDPLVVKKLEEQKINCQYGDVEDLELLQELLHEKVALAISTVGSLETNLLLLNTVRQANKKAIFTVVARTSEEALQLYEAGASYVVLPRHIGGDHMGTLIQKHGLNAEKYLKEKISHMKNLKKRKNA